MIYPVHNVLDVCISITRASGRGLGTGIREFFGPCEMESSQCRNAYSPVPVPIFTSTKIQLFFCNFVGHALKKIIYIKLTVPSVRDTGQQQGCIFSPSSSHPCKTEEYKLAKLPLC
jgi:hypothetical protein